MKWSILSLLLIACAEPTDIGERCSQDEAVVSRVLQPRHGENRVALDVTFERCYRFLCVSINGNDPYCTKRCARPDDCPAGFACEQPIEFGPLSRVCQDDAALRCEVAKYCVRADEWERLGVPPSSDAGI